MKDLACWVIALFLAPIAIVVAYFALQMVVSEIQPGFSESFVDFTNHPTKTTDENIGAVADVSKIWAISALIGFFLLAPTTNQIAWGWRRTKDFRYRLGTVHRTWLMPSLILLGSAFGIFVTGR